LQVINFLLRGWIRNLESDGSLSLPLLEEIDTINQTIERELEFPRKSLKKSVKVRYFASSVSLWDRIISYLKFYSKSKKVVVESQ